jgi:hypothetical protein
MTEFVLTFNALVEHCCANELLVELLVMVFIEGIVFVTVSSVCCMLLLVVFDIDTSAGGLCIGLMCVFVHRVDDV